MKCLLFILSTDGCNDRFMRHRESSSSAFRLFEARQALKTTGERYKCSKRNIQADVSIYLVNP